MQYHVPQFLEVEDKIIGQLTFKQFLYILGGIGLSYLSYTYLNIFIAIPVILASVALSAALAFVKINNKPFVFVVGSFIQYMFSPRLYIWKKMPKKIENEGDTEKNKNQSGVYIPPLSESNLKDLAWSLDIKENAAKNNVISSSKTPLLKDL